MSALDVSIQAQILNLMKDLQARHHLTFILISHDLAVVRYMVDTIGVMYLGKLVELGPAHEVYEHPAHPYTRGLIDTVPVADPALERAKEHQGVRGELPSAVAPPSGCRFRTRCPRAQDLCAAEEPPLRPFTADGHLAACHFAGQALPLAQPEAGHPPAQAIATPEPDAAAVLTVRDLRKNFRVRGSGFRSYATVHAVSGINLDLEPGRCLGLVGESGCGKSTVARLLMRLEQPSSGSIKLDGTELVGLDDRALRPFRRDRGRRLPDR